VAVFAFDSSVMGGLILGRVAGTNSNRSAGGQREEWAGCPVIVDWSFFCNSLCRVLQVGCRSVQDRRIPAEEMGGDYVEICWKDGETDAHVECVFGAFIQRRQEIWEAVCRQKSRYSIRDGKAEIFQLGMISVIRG